MTTAGDNITKANIVASMEAIRDTYNAGIVWHSGNQPFQTDITGGDATGYANQSFANDISDTNITASTIVANFRGYATLLSRIRNVLLEKYYQIQDNPTARLDFQQANSTNLNSNYAADMSAYGFNAGDTISATNLDQFVENLAAAIALNRSTTVGITEYHCHSNCHGSCHGSL